MVKLIGPKKIKTAIFISGRGSNLKYLIKFSLKKVSPIEVNLIISNNAKAKGLTFAKLYKIKKSKIDDKGRGLYASRDIKKGTKMWF